MKFLAASFSEQSFWTQNRDNLNKEFAYNLIINMTIQLHCISFLMVVIMQEYNDLWQNVPEMAFKSESMMHLQHLTLRDFSFVKPAQLH